MSTSKVAKASSEPLVPHQRAVTGIGERPTKSTSATSKIVNPYAKPKRPFVGGAEKARKNARRKKFRIDDPMEKQRQADHMTQMENQELKSNMNPFERFAAALLRTAPTEFIASDSDDDAALEVWTKVCRRVGLTPQPNQPIQHCYERASEHFSMRATLVLEEARCSLARALAARWKRGKERKVSPRNNCGQNKDVRMHMAVQYTERASSYGHLKVTFIKDSVFTKDELFHIRPGTVFQCMPRDSQRTVKDVILGIIIAGRPMVKGEDKRDFTVVLFRDVPSSIECMEFTLTPLTTWIQELRCFEATMASPKRIPFLQDLMGRPRKTHTRFDDDGNPQTQKTLSEYFQAKPNDVFNLPNLNENQTKAMNAFLTSSPKTVTLCQGPPGTGKTTLLVSTICRYLSELKPKDQHQKCLLVCAPTNKAVMVLANRFLNAMNPEKSNFNVLLLGDKEKLLGEDKHSKDNPARSCFLYTWAEAIADDYRTILYHFQPPTRKASRWKSSPTKLHRIASLIEKRMVNNNMGSLFKNLVDAVCKVTRHLLRMKDTSGKENKAALIDGSDIVPHLKFLIKEMDSIQKQQGDSVWTELIASAHIIFCTLTSAGGMILKDHSVSDLIVDEAAAATEPELYIPFHMRPSRLLAVGDPLQLPATIISRRAINLGFSESLHERLMYRCDFPYTMLDVQYRMRPDISMFPSSRFYEGKIQNGENVCAREYVGKTPLLGGRPYTFVDCAGEEEQDAGGSYKNQKEAEMVVNLILELQRVSGAAYMTQKAGPSAWHSASKIRVITFYHAQRKLLKRLLQPKGLEEKVTVATVDSSQGCEADIIIVSFVRSPRSKAIFSESGKYAAGFLTDDRRMNVSLTRAKYQLICVGNVEALARMNGAETLQKLAHDAKDRGVVKSLSNQRDPKPLDHDVIEEFYDSDLPKTTD